MWIAATDVDDLVTRRMEESALKWPNAKLSCPDQALSSGVMWMERKSGREKVTRGG
jgi:hypothetical protein